jgi:hypothetical protein
MDWSDEGGRLDIKKMNWCGARGRLERKGWI